MFLGCLVATEFYISSIDKNTQLTSKILSQFCKHLRNSQHLHSNLFIMIDYPRKNILVFCCIGPSTYNCTVHSSQTQYMYRTRGKVFKTMDA